MRSLTESVSAPPRLLVSVRDVYEASVACAAGVDVVDAKDPEAGALGALPVETVRAIVGHLGERVLTSAVADDRSAPLVAGIAAMARTGVDFVKVAVAGDPSRADLAPMAGAAAGRLIGVLFAEDLAAARGNALVGADDPAPGIVATLAAAGFRGAMIDTRVKDGRRLADVLSRDRLAAFTAACRAQGLLSGLAGSLSVDDVAELSAHAPGYLGFRGGLCRRGDRRGGLDPALIRVARERLAGRAAQGAA